MAAARFSELWSADRQVQNRAFHDFGAETTARVDWAYEVWDELLANLTHEDNHNRAIAAQSLCNLAKSDPEARIVEDFAALFAVTRDARFVTARHCLQALWKVGAAGERQRVLLVAALRGQFVDCAAEKNCTLIRYDIVESLRRVYDASGNEAIKAVALELIATEDDLKYRKKYARLWRVKP